MKRTKMVLYLTHPVFVFRCALRDLYKNLVAVIRKIDRNMKNLCLDFWSVSLPLTELIAVRLIVSSTTNI